MDYGKKTEENKCTCEHITVCTRDVCDCNPYCENNKALLEQHKAATPRFKKFITISPRPTSDSMEKQLTGWKIELNKLAKASKLLLIVAELNSSAQLHFHGVAIPKDLFKFNRIMRRISTWDNSKQHSAFKDGYHYLFKDVDYTRECIDHDPIIINKVECEQEMH